MSICASLLQSTSSLIKFVTGPIQTRIVAVLENEPYGRRCSSSKRRIAVHTECHDNCNTLIKAWGYESKDWIGQELELFLGTYKDWKSDPPEEKETVKVRAISPAKAATGNSGGAEQASAAAEQGGRVEDG